MGISINLGVNSTYKTKLMREISKYNVFQSITLKILSAAVKFLLIKVMLSYVDVSEYGAYTYSMAIFIFVMMLSRLGMDLYLQKEISSSKVTVNSAIGQALSVSSLSVMISAFCLLIFYKSEYLIFWLFFVTISFFYTSSWILNYVIKGKGYIKESIAIYELFLPLVNILGIIFFGVFFTGVKVLLFSFLTSILMTFILMFWFLMSKKVASKIYFTRPNIRGSYTFSLIAISTMLLVLGDTYLIGYLLSDYYVGIYSLTTKIGMFVLLPTAVVTTYINNLVSKNISEKNEIKKIIIPSLVFNFTLVSLFSMLIYIITPNILVFLNVGEVDSNKVISLLAVYLIAQVIMGSTGVFESVLMMGGGQKLLFNVNILMIIINISLGWLFITEWGVIGAVYSTLISCLVSKGIQMRLVYRKVLVTNV